MNDERITADATPAGELRRQILSQCVAKNEREWWAARTIEKLEFELNAANDRIKRLEEAGDAMAIYAELGIPLQFVGVVNAWRESKEAKP